jgi:hypothetical protein
MRIAPSCAWRTGMLLDEMTLIVLAEPGPDHHALLKA